jgi:hypothetical protein
MAEFRDCLKTLMGCNRLIRTISVTAAQREISWLLLREMN